MANKKKEEDKDKRECYECWRRRFRREMTEMARASKMDLPSAFDQYITEREERSKEVRTTLIDLRDESLELRLLAGDHYMNRYVDHEKKET